MLGSVVRPESEVRRVMDSSVSADSGARRHQALLATITAAAMRAAAVTVRADRAPNRFRSVDGMAVRTDSSAALALSRSNTASPMSRSRRPTGLVRQRRRSLWSAAGVDDGSACQSGSRSITAAIVSESVAPPNADPAGQHLVQHAAERPDICALVHGLAARLLRAHIRGGSENDPLARVAQHGGRLRQVGRRRRSPLWPDRSPAPSRRRRM